MSELGTLWAAALRPAAGFREALASGRDLRASLSRMLWLRLPVAVLDVVLTYWNLRLFLGSIRTLDGAFGSLLRRFLPPEVDLREVSILLKELPGLPAFSVAVPWLILAAVLGVFGLLLHHAVWDHTCLWILRGLKGPKTFRLSLAAEAEALSVGVFGALLGLLASLPVLGCVFGSLSTLAGVWFWGLRGVALATYHGCPLWKGILATGLHVLLFGLFLLVSAGLSLLLALLLVGQG